MIIQQELPDIQKPNESFLPQVLKTINQPQKLTLEKPSKLHNRTLSDFKQKLQPASNRSNSSQFARMNRRLKNSSVIIQDQSGVADLKQSNLVNEYKTNIEFFKDEVPQYFTNQVIKSKRTTNMEQKGKQTPKNGKGNDFKMQLLQFNQKQIPIVYIQNYTPEKEQYLSQFEQVYSDQNSKVSPKADGLQFDSQFEQGNLKEVYRQSANKYLLLMREDTNTKGYYQWFYYSVKQMKKGQAYTFQIMNYQKAMSLFQQGMKPSVCSNKQGKWSTKEVYGVKYKENKCFSRKNNRKLYTLTFTYDCIQDDDTVFFALTEPYTITRLKNLLSNMSGNKLVKVENLCKSLMDIDIPIITFNGQEEYQYQVIICARMHPGEVQGSFIAEGVIQHLLSDKFVRLLQKHNVVIKIIPMLNPDGVLYGNTRTCVLGGDLNRKWDNPQAALQPQIHALKQLMEESKDKLLAFIDLHGHSKRLGSFFYGNQFKALQDKLTVKQLPLAMRNNLPHLFSYEACRFIPSGIRHNSARVVVGQNIINSFTLETSFYGYKKQGICQAYTEKDYFAIGEGLIKSLFQIIDQPPEILRSYNSPTALNTFVGTPMINRKDMTRKTMDFLQMEDQGMDAVSESDSEASIDQLDQAEMKQIEVQAYKIQNEQRNARSLSQARVSTSTINNQSSLVNITDLINHYKHLRVQQKVNEKKLSQEAHKLRCTSISTVNISGTPNRSQVININGMINLKSQETKQYMKPINSGQFNKFMYQYKNQQSKRQSERREEGALMVAFEQMKMPKKKEVYTKLLKKGLMYQQMINE